MSDSLTKGHENKRDKNVPSILNLGMDRRGFLTQPERFSSKKGAIKYEERGNDREKRRCSTVPYT